MSEGMAQARAVATVDYLDSGSGNASVELYQGTAPVTAGGPPTGSLLLVAIGLPKPCATVVGRNIVFEISDLGTILNSGEAMWARWRNGAGVWAGDSDVTVEAGDGFVRMASTTLYEGGKAQLLGGTVG
jgi:hypothetical protein